MYENPSFKLTASCASDGPTVVLRPKLDHGAYALAASSLNTTQALYSNNSDTSTTGPSAVRFFTNPEEAGTLTYVAPAGGSVTTITYTLNSLFAGRDCVFAGNAVTL